MQIVVPTITLPFVHLRVLSKVYRESFSLFYCSLGTLLSCIFKTYVDYAYNLSRRETAGNAVHRTGPAPHESTANEKGFSSRRNGGQNVTGS